MRIFKNIMNIFTDIIEWVIETFLSMLLIYIAAFGGTMIVQSAFKFLGICSYNYSVCAITGIICACIQFICCVIEKIDDICLTHKIYRADVERKKMDIDQSKDFDW